MKVNYTHPQLTPNQTILAHKPNKTKPKPKLHQTQQAKKPNHPNKHANKIPPTGAVQAVVLDSKSGFLMSAGSDQTFRLWS